MSWAVDEESWPGDAMLAGDEMSWPADEMLAWGRDEPVWGRHLRV